MEDTEKKINTHISEMSEFYIIAETHQFLLNIFPRGAKLQVNSIRLRKMLHDFPLKLAVFYYFSPSVRST